MAVATPSNVRLPYVGFDFDRSDAAEDHVKFANDVI
jgi:hypothetical protein